MTKCNRCDGHQWLTDKIGDGGGGHPCPDCASEKYAAWLAKQPKVVDVYDLKEMVKDNRTVYFTYYRDGNLWYKSITGFEFPVPIEDIGNATFLASDKAILFMRYIRKHLKLIQSGANND